VAQWLELFQATGQELVYLPKKQEHLSLQTYLEKEANLSQSSSKLLKALIQQGASHLTSYLTTPSLQEKTPFDILKENLPYLPPLEDLPSILLPLRPRFYSIANSPYMHPNQLHLLVTYVTYQVGDFLHKGTCSHFLCKEAFIQQTPISIYIQPTPHFTLPQDLSQDIICIGPGTGIAPFRAFIQERLFLQASGRNWIFFGEQTQLHHYYYRPFWEDLHRQKFIHLSLAFSRDQPDKVYVQHKMWEARKELWGWIEGGACLYVCGDAKKMAKEVDQTLLQIIKEMQGVSEETARLIVKELRKDKRYLTDVY
jgi:sulfite reductase (NADPH) flavoprotein alpha-component